MTDGRSPVGMTSLGPEATAVWQGDGQALALATARAAPGAAIRPPGTALSLPLLTLQGHRNAVGASQVILVMWGVKMKKLRERSLALSLV